MELHGEAQRVSIKKPKILNLFQTSIENEEDFEAWGFNKQVIRQIINISMMHQYGQLMQNLSFYKRLENFKKWLDA